MKRCLNLLLMLMCYILPISANSPGRVEGVRMWSEVVPLESVGGKELTFVGHSKGGAEAAGNALATNKNALLYNPAAIYPSKYGLDASNYTGFENIGIHIYVIEGKIVSRMVPGTAGAVTTTVYSYNTMHRLLTLRTNGSDGKAISARRYTYDNVGNITQLRDIVTGMVHNYSYDGYYQLTGGSGQSTDNSGNAYYGITVDYDRMHRPVAKNQQMGQRGMLFPGDVTVGYGLNYNYSATHKFRLESVYRHHFRSEADVMVEGDVIHDVCRFSYDSNGNMTGIVTDRPAADGHTERRIAERFVTFNY